MTESDPQFMQSLARGLAVLEAFAELGPDQTIATLAQHTALPRGVIGRCLHTLAALGYVEPRGAQGHGRRWAARPHVLRLADAYLSERSPAVIAQPVLELLRDSLGESCSLGVLDGNEVLYVARASSSRRLVSIGLHVGSRLPAWCTSMGRVLLAALPAQGREKLIPADPLPRRTTNTVPSRAALLAVLDGVASTGHALVDQELESGLRSLAVPVRDSAGRVIAALNVGTHPASHQTGDLTERFLPELKAAAADLGMRIGRAGSASV